MRRGFRGLSQLGGLNLSLESSIRDLPSAPVAHRSVPDHVHVAHPLAATKSSPSRWPTVPFGAAASSVMFLSFRERLAGAAAVAAFGPVLRDLCAANSAPIPLRVSFELGADTDGRQHRASPGAAPSCATSW